MRTKLFSAIKYLLFLSIGGALLLLAFKGVDLKTTMHEIKEANIFFVFLSIVASTIAFVSRAYRWNILIEPLGFKPKLSNTTYSLLVGYLANLALPRIGEVTRCGALTKAEKIPFEELIGTVIVERAIDVITLLLLILLTAFVEFERLGNFLYQNLFIPMKDKIYHYLHSPLFIMGCIFLIAIVVILIRALRKNSGKHGFISRISTLLKGIMEGLRSVRKIKRPWAFLFHTVLIWSLYFFAGYICFFSLPATSQLTWQAGLFVLIVGGIGMAAPVQGGIGIFHLLVSKGLLLYAIPYEHGIAFATLLHSTQAILVILLGTISFTLLFLADRKSSFEPSTIQKQKPG